MNTLLLKKDGFTSISKKIKETTNRFPLIKSIAIFLLLFIFFIIVSPVSPKTGQIVFLTKINLLDLFEAISCYAIGAFGMTLVLIVGCIDLSCGSIIGLCSVVMGFLLEVYHVPTLPSILIVIAIAVVCSLLNAVVIVHFKVLPFLTTICTASLFSGIAYLISGAKTIYITNNTFNKLFGPSGRFLGIPVIVLWVTLFGVFMYLLTSHSKFGRRAQAVGGNEFAAFSSGVKVGKIRFIAYALMGLLSAFCAMILCGRLTSAGPMYGEGYDLNFIMAAILGGTNFDGDGGNIIGTLIGALIMGMLTNGFNLIGINFYVQEIITGIIILGVVISSYNKSRKKRA